MKDQEIVQQQKQTISEIKARLNEEITLSEDYLAFLQMDTRKGVQQALKSFEKKQLKAKQVLEQFESMQKYERQARLKGYQIIAGVDEVGRGPLAGPVVSAAVILPENCDLVGINDSKQLTKADREAWVGKINEQAIAVHYSIVTAQEIDRYNIYEATRRSMKLAVEGLAVAADYVLIDAMTIDSSISQERIIKGDAKSISIAAASIVAKVVRDKLMEDYAIKYPHYGFENNAGYGTKEHLEALKNYGATPIHRQSFKPVRDVL